MLVGLLSALVATVLNTVAGLLQSDAATRIRPRRPLAGQPRYLLGLVVDGLGWVATVVALRHLPVFAVQAILGGAIALTALATRWRTGMAMRRPDQIAVVACVLGLMLVAGSAGGDGPVSVGAVADIVLAGAAAVLAGVLVALRKLPHRVAVRAARRARLRRHLARGARRAPLGRLRTGPGRAGGRTRRLPGDRVLAGRDDQLLAGAGPRGHRRRHGRLRHHRGGGARV